MTSRLIGRFVVAVEQATRAEHGPGPLTRHGGRLVVPREARAECAVLKAVAAHYVMHAAERVALHVRQREVVAELVAAFEADPDRLDPDLRRDWDDAGRRRRRPAGARRPGRLAHRRAGADPAPAVVPPGDDLDSRAVERHPRGGSVAGRIKAEDIATVKERTSIEDVVRDHVTLRPAGVGSLKGLCPFHDEKTPSFTVRPTVGSYHCFGCGEGGDVISFVQKVEHLTFTESIERLAAKLGLELRYEEGGGAPRGWRVARQALAADRGAPGRAGVLRRAAARHRPPRRPGRPRLPARARASTAPPPRRSASASRRRAARP